MVGGKIMKSPINLLVLPGDGIGPEIMLQAMRVFDLLKDLINFDFRITYAKIGGAAYDEYGVHFPDSTQHLCSSADIILFGAVGGPVSDQQNSKWKNCEVNSILALRKLLDLYANIRPVKIDEALINFSPLRLERFLPKLANLIVVRELSGDIYFGNKGRRTEGSVAYDECTYSISQIERITRFALELASKRDKKIHSIDKANVLETSRLWREVVAQVSKENTEICIEDMLVDNCAMQLINNPTIFDVVLTSNMFGDILSDAAAVIPGSLGLLASASYGSQGRWLFEPPSGSAPDIAGRNIANPIGMIRCVSLMFELVFNQPDISMIIEKSIEETLKKGYFTADLCLDNREGLSTEGYTDQLIKEIKIRL